MTESAIQTTVSDRLSSMLFLAVLFHGIVILGITFTSEPLSEPAALPTLRVTLLVDTVDIEREPENFDYLAQRNQRGAGQAKDSRRPAAAPAANDPANLSGSRDGADIAEAEPRRESLDAEQIVTRGPSEDRVLASPDPNQAEAAVPMHAMALLHNPSPATTVADLDEQSTLSSKHPRELVISPATKQSSVAAYLNEWRRRVERIGTLNFPRHANRDADSSWPTLEVAINTQGDLVEIVLRESSGDAVLDQAALTILQMAAPFDPLPAEISADYDVLRFAYEWQFFGDSAGANVAAVK